MDLIKEDCVCSKHNQEQLMHNLWVFYYFFSKITFYLKLFSDCYDQFGYRGPLYTCLVALEIDRKLCIKDNLGSPQLRYLTFFFNFENVIESRTQISLPLSELAKARQGSDSSAAIDFSFLSKMMRSIQERPAFQYGAYLSTALT